MPSLSSVPSASAPKEARVAACYCLHDDTDYLAVSIASLRSVPVPPALFAFVSRIPWHQKPGDWEAARVVAEASGASVVVGDWPSEREQRQAACDYLLVDDVTHRTADIQLTVSIFIPGIGEEINDRMVRSVLIIKEALIAVMGESRHPTDWDPIAFS